MPNGYEITNILVGMARGERVRKPEGVSTIYWNTSEGKLIDYPEQRLIDWLEKLGYLTAERYGAEESLGQIDYKLTPKAERFVAARNGGVANANERFWVVVYRHQGHRGLFVHMGSAAPDLGQLGDAGWSDGDEINITCHDPKYVPSADSLFSKINATEERI